jgi:hypothetical protein
MRVATSNRPHEERLRLIADGWALSHQGYEEEIWTNEARGLVRRFDGADWFELVK